MSPTGRKRAPTEGRPYTRIGFFSIALQDRALERDLQQGDLRAVRVDGELAVEDSLPELRAEDEPDLVLAPLVQGLELGLDALEILLDAGDLDRLGGEIPDVQGLAQGLLELDRAEVGHRRSDGEHRPHEAG